MPYIPNASTLTEPTASREVVTAAEEFRRIKEKLNTVDEFHIQAMAEEREIRAAADTLETAERIAGDSAIVDMVSPYISQIANLGFTGNLDLGLVSDPIVSAGFDFGSI